jgi:hypothetical protein
VSQDFESDLLALTPSRLPKLAIKPWIPPSPKPLTLLNALVVDPATGKLLNGKQTVKFGKDGKFISVSQAGMEEEDGVTVDIDGLYLCP